MGKYTYMKLNDLLTRVNQKLANASYFYLSNDPERALGLEKLVTNFHVVFIDQSQYSQYFIQQHIPYFCLDEHRSDDVFRSSAKLIKAPEFIEYFNANKKQTNYIQTFKISSAFAMQVNAMGAISMNTSAALNHQFEDKISQYENIKDLGISLPITFVDELQKFTYADLKVRLGEVFVVQFDRGHTGSGTVFVKTADDFLQLQKLYPARHVRVSQFIEGRAYTLNACVGKNGVYLSGLSTQITGVEGLTPNQGGTIGNDWNFRGELRNGTNGLVRDVIRVGNHMRASGYKGLFGVDLIVRPDGTHVLIEINARQPASIPMQTKMQLDQAQIPLMLIHMAEFLGVEYDIAEAEYNAINLQALPYSQVFIRPANEMLISTQVVQGVYSLKGDSIDNKEQILGEVTENVLFLDEDKDKAIQLISPGYCIDNLVGGGFLLLTQNKDRIIAANAELARVQLKQPALDESGDLKAWIKEVLFAVKDYQI
jgi:glutathione synthase/RimK-type ligase-like ATP-grasp enzyme